MVNKVYGVDINKKYLNVCLDRYPQLQEVLDTICADLTEDITILPNADLLVANLFAEYVGYKCFQKTVEQVKPRYISCAIQINTDASWVSDLPYVHVFDDLDKVHNKIEENTLIDSMAQIGYKKKMQAEKVLPNSKKLVRIDFERGCLQ